MQKQTKNTSEYVKKEEVNSEVKTDEKSGTIDQDNNNNQANGSSKNTRNNPRRKSPKEKEQGDQEAKPQKENQKSKRPPKDFSWKEELKKTVTLETKIPPYPTKEELLELPNRNRMLDACDDVEDEIEDLFYRIDDLNIERKSIKRAIFNKSKGDREAISKLIKEAKELNNLIDKEHDKLNTVKDEKKKTRRENYQT